MSFLQRPILLRVLLGKNCHKLTCSIRTFVIIPSLSPTKVGQKLVCNMVRLGLLIVGGFFHDF